MEMTDVRQLKAFVAVAEELNFHRAAEKLGTVQPALSRMIRNLEADMDVTLFMRTTRSVTLTESGKVFLAEARLLLSQLSSAIRTTQAAERGTMGSIWILLSTHSCPIWCLGWQLRHPISALI
jgi:DNA-binding transcriptional LysR family regulator